MIQPDNDRRPRLRGLVLPQLRRQRDLQGLTQAEVAQAAGISLPTVISAEAGHVINGRTGRRIAQALGVKLTELMKQPPK